MNNVIYTTAIENFQFDPATDLTPKAVIYQPSYEATSVLLSLHLSFGELSFWIQSLYLVSPAEQSKTLVSGILLLSIHLLYQFKITHGCSENQNF